MQETREENSTISLPDEAGVSVDVGDVTELTEGQGGGNSEDKRRAYNC